jgi:hypothetical protein
MRHNRARRHAFIPLAIAIVPAIAVACTGGDDGQPAPTTSPAVVSPRPAATPDAVPTRAGASAEPTPAGTVEVQGVVGAVDVGTRTITIKPTGEAQFTRIILEPGASIKRAGGGNVRLQDVRASDRIIAVGRPGDDPATLLSADVTIQAVIPGAQPGG